MAPTPHTQNDAVKVPEAAPTSQPQVQVRSYRPEDHAEVVEMFKAGMLFYAADEVKKIYTEYIAHSLEEDLADIKGTYFASGGHFWIATIQENDKEAIVGMVGLEGKPNQEGELRRMSIKSEYRRFGVGRVLVKHLEDWAKENGMKKVWLSTGGVMVQARKFYLSIGYDHWKTEVYSQDPYFEVVYFEKAL
ncbi:hypothetical protein Poli38472_009967 [Pythium oligandrum]|uniref:N-acetyltransferase domain-containing protein n=1 Tax=Pythium oligandrum TaxID=41045 RepID=A0A8K1FH46_PYTOL|nr:hypothetical protein Poli38472_009967 [Pythium oligandrum]|eukprot:TMW58408.1 hypothetical protein Poli38472_009967 [Pythium oligandrum]